MTRGWKEMIFKVPCSPNLNSVRFQRNSPYKQDGGEKSSLLSLDSPGFQVDTTFLWAKSEEALETPQDHGLGGQKDRNERILYICMIAFSSVGVFPFSAARAED